MMNLLTVFLIIWFVAAIAKSINEQIMNIIEISYRNLSVIFLIVSAVLGQVYGMYRAIKHWNDKDKDNVDIFYWLFMYWFVAIFIAILAVPALIVGIPAYVITKMRD